MRRRVRRLPLRASAGNIRSAAGLKRWMTPSRSVMTTASLLVSMMREYRVISCSLSWISSSSLRWLLAISRASSTASSYSLARWEVSRSLAAMMWENMVSTWKASSGLACESRTALAETRTRREAFSAITSAERGAEETTANSPAMSPGVVSLRICLSVESTSSAPSSRK